MVNIRQHGLYATVRYLKNQGLKFSEVVKALDITNEIEFNYVKTVFVK